VRVEVCPLFAFVLSGRGNALDSALIGLPRCVPIIICCCLLCFTATTPPTPHNHHRLLRTQHQSDEDFLDDEGGTEEMVGPMSDPIEAARQKQQRKALRKRDKEAQEEARARNEAEQAKVERRQVAPLFFPSWRS
jgi:hypothetical protein